MSEMPELSIRPSQATSSTEGTQDTSLTSPPPERPRSVPHNTYLGEGYRDQNSWIAEQDQQNAEFSLARTFPHRVRWADREGQNTADSEKGETERATQVAAAEEIRADHQDPPRGDSNATTEVGSEDEVDKGGERPNTAPTSGRRSDALRSGGGRSMGDVTETKSTNPNEIPRNPWARFRRRFQYPLAEWLGTTLLIFIGISGDLAIATSDQKAGTANSMYWCWGFAVMLGIYTSGGGSGGFLNPAVTIMLSVFRGFPAKHIPTYILAQILGAFTGALLAYAVYRDAIYHSEGGEPWPASTGQYFYTQPQEWVTPATAFFTEFFGTAVLGGSILALGDSGNSPPGAGMHALIIGLLVTTCSMAFGNNTHGCFNPVRDFGPRVAIVVVGFPKKYFSAGHNWWIWGPWVATITGALFGGLMYDLCLFRGSESPVNYSHNKCKLEVRKGENALFRMFQKHEKVEQIEEKIEDGVTYEAQMRNRAE